MAINSVSFGDSIQDLINKPQKYTTQPAASSKVQGDEFKKSHKGLKVATGIAALAAIGIAALAVISQRPETIEKIKNWKFLKENESLRNLAKNAKNFGEQVYNGAKNFFAGLKAKAPEVADEAKNSLS